jgi:hypothetical protein
MNDQSAYSKVLATGEQCLLSPEQLLKLKGGLKSDYNVHISDTYSIGNLFLTSSQSFLQSVNTFRLLLNYFFFLCPYLLIVGMLTLITATL